jgi:hypothetical protein
MVIDAMCSIKMDIESEVLDYSEFNYAAHPAHRRFS